MFINGFTDEANPNKIHWLELSENPSIFRKNKYKF